MDRKMSIAGGAAKRASCVEFLKAKFEAQGYEVQVLTVEENGNQGNFVQIRPKQAQSAGGWLKKLSGLETCASVKLMDRGADLDAEVLAGKWMDKVAAGAISMVVLWPLMVTASIGAFKQKAMLDDVWKDTLTFLVSNG